MMREAAGTPVRTHHLPRTNPPRTPTISHMRRGYFAKICMVPEQICKSTAGSRFEQICKSCALARRGRRPPPARQSVRRANLQKLCPSGEQICKSMASSRATSGGRGGRGGGKVVAPSAKVLPFRGSKSAKVRPFRGRSKSAKVVHVPYVKDPPEPKTQEYRHST